MKPLTPSTSVQLEIDVAALDRALALITVAPAGSLVFEARPVALESMGLPLDSHRKNLRQCFTPGNQT